MPLIGLSRKTLKKAFEKDFKRLLTNLFKGLLKAFKRPLKDLVKGLLTAFKSLLEAER